MIPKIDPVVVLEIQSVEKDLLLMKVLLNKDIIDFEFRTPYDLRLNATLIKASRNFLDLARYNHPYQNEILGLVKKFIHEEQLLLPVTINFTT